MTQNETEPKVFQWIIFVYCWNFVIFQCCMMNNCQGFVDWEMMWHKDLILTHHPMPPKWGQNNEDLWPRWDVINAMCLGRWAAGEPDRWPSSSGLLLAATMALYLQGYFPSVWGDKGQWRGQKRLFPSLGNAGGGKGCSVSATWTARGTWCQIRWLYQSYLLRVLLMLKTSQTWSIRSARWL